MVYLAIHGELFEGVVTTTENEDGTTVCEVVTQGFGGEIETNITFDADSRITAILPAGQAVRGPCLVVRVDDEGEIVDLTPEDIEHLDACVLIGNIIDLAHYVRRFSVIAKRLAETVAEAEP